MEDTKTLTNKVNLDFDFDLPEVEQTKVEPKVKIAGDVCVSCEG